MATKASISADISKRLNVNKSQSLKITNAFFDLIAKRSKKDKVKLNKFGTFTIHQTKERLGRNPKTKESYIITKMFKVKFKPSNMVREVLN